MIQRPVLNLTMPTMTAVLRPDTHLLKIVAKSFPSLIDLHLSAVEGLIIEWSPSWNCFQDDRYIQFRIILTQMSKCKQTKFRSKEYHIQKNNLLSIWYIYYSITSQKQNGGYSWLIGIDILDLEEALVEDGGSPLRYPASITKVLHGRRYQYQLKKIRNQICGCSPNSRCTCEYHHRKLTSWQEPGPSHSSKGSLLSRHRHFIQCGKLTTAFSSPNRAWWNTSASHRATHFPSP